MPGQLIDGPCSRANCVHFPGGRAILLEAEADLRDPSRIEDILFKEQLGTRSATLKEIKHGHPCGCSAFLWNQRPENQGNVND